MINNEKEILWFFSQKNPHLSPSSYLGGVLPASYLNIKQIIFLENHDAKKTLLIYKPKVILINKIFHKGMIDLAYEAKNFGIKIISIFDDWHFDEKINQVLPIRFERNLRLAKLSDSIVVKTDSAKAIVFKNTGFKPRVIPDPIRFTTVKPLSNIRYPLELSWFGMFTNHDTIKPALDKINQLNVSVKLTIITNKLENIKKILSENNYTNIQLFFVKWVFGIEQKEVIKSDIVILPYPDDVARKVKSSNRIIDSLNLGRCVLMSDVNQFNEFRDFCYFGDISEGIKIILKNKHAAIEKTLKGQKYVLKNYNLDVVAKKWELLIKGFV